MIFAGFVIKRMKQQIIFSSATATLKRFDGINFLEGLWLLLSGGITEATLTGGLT